MDLRSVGRHPFRLPCQLLLSSQECCFNSRAVVGQRYRILHRGVLCMPMWLLTVMISGYVHQSTLYLLPLPLLRDGHLLFSRLTFSTPTAAAPGLTRSSDTVPSPPDADFFPSRAERRPSVSHLHGSVCLFYLLGYAQAGDCSFHLTASETRHSPQQQ